MLFDITARIAIIKVLSKFLLDPRLMSAKTHFKRVIESLDSNKKHIIAIQGCSSSGKTTLSQHLTKELTRSGIPNVLISLDNYYSTFTGTEEDVVNYDFDNPKALDWDAVRETLDSYSAEGKTVVEYKYSFKTRISTRVIVPNVYPKVIIIEGIFGFNIVNDKIFNIKEFDAYNSDKVIKQEYIENDIDLNQYNILKIQMLLDKERMMNVRVERDVQSNNATREQSILRFNTKIWPSTQRWIYTKYNVGHIVIKDGTFNLDECDILSESILNYFDSFNEKYSFKREMLGFLSLKKKSIKV
jgi:uridine kinase